MPDISMCLNDDCPAKTGCYRHEASGAIPTERRQSFIVASPTLDDEGKFVKCDYYLPRMEGMNE